MEQFETGDGYAKITADTVEFDIDRLHAAKQIYHRSKLLTGFLMLCGLYISVLIVTAPELFPWQFILILAALVGGLVAWKYIDQRWRKGLTRAETIQRDAVEMVVYGEGGRLSQPEMAVVYQDNSEQKIRQIIFAHRLLGGVEDLQDARDAFRSAGIEVKSLDEVEEM